ncbi:unnamed protein product [Ambrosiozyma monospora]|uniref:Unnamed protein product n=1 Tax=Ambrosiozyma monospora TaxID=43982 RepID=A0A9W6Z2X9_AMBMO|nr:unnamed protein product [Ambrosiozyma monospora]
MQTALTVYAKLMGQQAQNVFDQLISKLDMGILTKDPAFEWDSFVAKDTANFIDLNLPMRHSSEIQYKGQNDPLSFEIRSGYLERKSKYLKSYTRAWYVLTPCFIHEFKSSDRKKDPYPSMSLPLEDCSISEHSRKDDKNPDAFHKFVLHTKSSGGGLMSKGHNWVFKAMGYDQMMLWYNDLKKLTQMPTPQSRTTVAWERRKSRRLASLASGTPTRSSSVSTTRTSRAGVGSRSSYLANSSAGTNGPNGPNGPVIQVNHSPRHQPSSRMSQRMSLRNDSSTMSANQVSQMSRMSMSHDSLSTHSADTDTMLAMPVRSPQVVNGRGQFVGDLNAYKPNNRGEMLPNGEFSGKRFTEIDRVDDFDGGDGDVTATGTLGQQDLYPSADDAGSRKVTQHMY